MDFTAFNYLTDFEQKKVRQVFQGWRREYLQALEFRKVEDGWLCRDLDLGATVYMHLGSNGGKTKDG